VRSARGRPPGKVLCRAIELGSVLRERMFSSCDFRRHRWRSAANPCACAWRFVLCDGQLVARWTCGENRRTWVFANEYARLNQHQAQRLYLAVRVNNSGVSGPVRPSSALRGKFEDTQLGNRPRIARPRRSDGTLPFAGISQRPSLKITLQVGLKKNRGPPCDHHGS
jgi:hypothetical protein